MYGRRPLRTSANIAVNDSAEVVVVATLTIRGFDDELHARLRVQAARHGRSMEAEVRAVLADHLLSTPSGSDRLGSRIHARFAAMGGGDLELPSRDDVPRAAVFE
jgi:antitoxin FitA